MNSQKKVVKIPMRMEPVGPKKYPYKLDDDAKTRREALIKGIKAAQKRYKVSETEAAMMKKKKLNVLRIYRKNTNPIHCRKITYDIKFLDKKYNFDTTKDICKK
jgi:hypothetical protein